MLWSFDTMIMTFFASFILFLIACVLFVSSKRIIIVDYRTLAFICTLSIIRLLVPIEFSFTTTLNLNQTLSEIPFFFYRQHACLHYFSISLWDGLIILWGMGIVVYLCKYIKNYRKDKLLIQNLGVLVSNNKKYSELITSVCLDYGIKQRFEIYEISGLPTPMIFSIHKPCILLPAQNQYTDQDLLFIFRHEVGHFAHHHLFYQLLVELFLIIYWWNPFNSYIKGQIDALLEMNIDRMFSTTADETTAYLNCLLKVKKQALQQKVCLSNASSLSMDGLQESVLEKRFKILTSSQKHFSVFSLVLILICISIFSLSYCFTVKGYSIPDEAIQGEIFQLTDENSYGISNGDGTYDIYFSGEYIETVNSLKGYDSVPIYNSLDDVPQN